VYVYDTDFSHVNGERCKVSWSVSNASTGHTNTKFHIIHCRLKRAYNRCIRRFGSWLHSRLHIIGFNYADRIVFTFHFGFGGNGWDRKRDILNTRLIRQPLVHRTISLKTTIRLPKRRTNPYSNTPRTRGNVQYNIRTCLGIKQVIMTDLHLIEKGFCNDDVLGCDAQDGDSMFLRNVGIYLRVYTASQPTSTTSSYVPPWGPKNHRFLWSNRLKELF
jgi:hypothetical protein